MTITIHWLRIGRLTLVVLAPTILLSLLHAPGWWSLALGAWIGACWPEQLIEFR
jgi:hypothetical protein